MNYLLILFVGAAFVATAYSSVISAENEEDEKSCPPPDSISPCTCTKGRRVVATCKKFQNAYDLQKIFDKNPHWTLDDLKIENCSMNFLPAKMLEDAFYDRLYITSTSVNSLFDHTPVKTPKFNLYLQDVQIRKGFDWKSIAGADLQYLKIVNMKMRKIGKEFKDNIQPDIQVVRLENTGVSVIKDQPFTPLTKVIAFALVGGNLMTLSRDMFPKPWNVNQLDFSNQKISKLPENFFVDMPHLSNFYMKGNKLPTISEKVFILHEVTYNFIDNPIVCNCDVKWIVGDEGLSPEKVYGECAKPDSLKGQKLGALKPSNFGHCK